MKSKEVFVLGVFSLLCIYLFFGGIIGQEPEISSTAPIVETTSPPNELIEDTAETPSDIIEEETIQEQEDTKEIEAISEEEVEEKLGDGGINSGFLHDVDVRLDRWFQSDLENREERIAEVRTLIQEGNIDEAKELLKLYEEFAQQAEEEVTPEERDDAVESSKIIRKAIKNIEDKIPDEEREAFEKVTEREQRIKTAAEIADKINSLCNQLVELGEFKKAHEVCNLENNEKESPTWLKRKRDEWKKEISDDAQKFFEVLNTCMDVTSDDIKGNYDQCHCDEMPSAQQELCFQIAQVEDEGGDASTLIEQFMKGLPNDLKVAVERSMSTFEEEGYERNRPQGCETIDFKDCQEHEFRKRAPGPCLNALDRGEIEPTREACEKIMFEENAPSECLKAGATSPDECAALFEGYGPGSGKPDHGVVFQVCDKIPGAQARLACYDANGDNADFAGEYYKERKKYREEGFESFDHNEFDKKFRQENADKYADIYARRKNYQSYYNNEEDDRRRVEETLDREEMCVKQCASEGKAWNFRNGNCVCSGGDSRRYDQYRYDSEQSSNERQINNDRFIEECSSRGGRWDCSGGQCTCEFEERETYSEPLPQTEPSEEKSSESTISEGSSNELPESQDTSKSTPESSSDSSESGGTVTTGMAIVEDNSFLNYYFE